MIIGLDRSFKPEWVYKMLQLAKPGSEFSQLKENFLDIIEYDGLKSKLNVLTIIRRYYLKFEKKDKKELLVENYLHDLSLKYSFESLKPVLLFVLLLNCPIAEFIQSKINLLFNDQEDIDKKLLDNNTKEVYGDRRVVNYAVGYYLTILTYFDVLSKEKNKYFWKNRKLTVSNDILKEILIVYSQLRDDFEIDVASIYDEVPFKFINLENLETVLMEFNSKDWSYQKRFNSKKVIVKNKYKHFSLE